jgi:hypothetical protein
MRIPSWAKVDARWYLGVRCRKCDVPIIFALDHSERDAQPKAPRKLRLTCSGTECRHQADYSKATVIAPSKSAMTVKETSRG